jgi:putative transposase
MFSQHHAHYVTNLTDTEWTLLGPLLPGAAHTGRPRRHSWRTILDAIFSQLRTGGAWRFLPQEWPPWQTVYHYFRTWRRDGTWQQIHTVLRETIRAHLGRDPQPSAGSIDSQSVKTTGVGGERGYDSGKKVKGRKRHVLVDTEGFVLTVSVHAADIMDRDGVKQLLPHDPHDPQHDIRTHFPRLRHVWLDSGYNGTNKGKDWIERTLGWSAQIVAHRRRPSKVWIFDDLPDDQIDWSKYLPPPGFRVLPRRWVVERTFAWQGQNRRLSKDYEQLCSTSEALIYVAMIRLMLRRLARF